MNSQNLIIYDFRKLYEILQEIEHELNFKILNFSAEDLKKIKVNKEQNYLLVTKKKLPNFKNQFILPSLPIKIFKLIEKINVQFLKIKFVDQSKIKIGPFIININSREMTKDELKLRLTEKECEIIIYLSKSSKPISINELQLNVWGHSSKLETHTVETHVYRLRKKISKTFNNINFISSEKNGYQIK